MLGRSVAVAGGLECTEVLTVLAGCQREVERAGGAGGVNVGDQSRQDKAYHNEQHEEVGGRQNDDSDTSPSTIDICVSAGCCIFETLEVCDSGLAVSVGSIFD